MSFRFREHRARGHDFGKRLRDEFANRRNARNGPLDRSALARCLQNESSMCVLTAIFGRPPSPNVTRRISHGNEAGAGFPEIAVAVLLAMPGWRGVPRVCTIRPSRETPTDLAELAKPLQVVLVVIDGVRPARGVRRGRRRFWPFDKALAPSPSDTAEAF